MAFQGDSIFWVEVEKIVANPYQPRREFDEQRLKELAESVRMYGILQPLTVTRKEIQNPDGSFRSEYELIAGERRLRASKLAGLVQVPVIIRDGEQTEQEKLELAIIENLQREDLNAVDRALAFRQLADVFGLSHVQVAKKVGRSREYVSNSIRLLALPDYMLNSLRGGDISEGHARTLLMLNDRPEEQDTVYREILLKKLSVREVEKIARGIAIEKVRKRETLDTELLEFERQFTESLGTRVNIVKTEYGGKVTIDYFSIEDLEAILEKMKDDAAATSTTLPAEGENRERIELEEDKETERALEVLAENTGLMEVVSPPPPAVPVPVSVPMVTTPVAPAEANLASATESDTSEVSPTEIVDVPTPAPTPVTPVGGGLRAQLATLLGGQGAAIKPTPSITPQSSVVPSGVAKETPDQNQSPVVPNAKPQSPVEPAAPTTPANDDSDLYSMTKFTI